MKKLAISLAGVALVAAPLVAGSLSEPAVARPGQQVVIDPPPDLCTAHIRCPDGGDGGVDPTPDDGCPVNRPCNYDAPGYEKPDVPPPDDIPGKKIEPKTKSKAKSSTTSKVKEEIPPPDCGSHVPCPGDPPVAEAKAPRAIKAQPRTVG